MDWGHVEDIIKDDWEKLPEEIEVLLASGLMTRACKVSGQHRSIDRNLIRTTLFPPRFAIALPALAVRHIDGGGEIRFRRQDLSDWYFWPNAMLILAEHRPGLAMDLILKREEDIALALSKAECDWYEYATWFIWKLAYSNPDCLQRVLAQVSTSTARGGWAASLEEGRGFEESCELAH